MFKNLSVQKLIAVNTASNYALMAVRVLQGILITRWLFHYLGESYYGFWSILWAFFTYMIVFNLGFGAATQKYTAEHLFETDIKKYNSIISIVFGFYGAIAAIIAAIAVAASFFIPFWTGLSDAREIETCQKVLIIFGVGTAVLFPMAMFSDILVGLRLIYLKNASLLGVRLFELFGIYAIMHFDGGFIAIVTYSVTVNIAFDFILIAMVKYEIKGFSFIPSFDRQTFRQIYNFSAFAYLNSIGNLIIAKTDRFVLGAILGLPAVSAYQLGTRVPELSQMVSSQFQENVVPVSANLIHAGDTKTLSKILLSGMRFGAFMSVGATVLFFILSEQIIEFMFAAQSADITLICRYFLISQLVTCVVRGVPSRYLLMSGRHKFVSLATLAEAGMNLFLSIWLCREIGIMGVVWGTLIPNVLISCFVVLPPAIKALKFTFVDLSLIFIKPFFAVAPSAALCVWAQSHFGQTLSQFVPLISICAVSGGMYLVASWIFVLTKSERDAIKNKIFKTRKS